MNERNATSQTSLLKLSKLFGWSLPSSSFSTSKVSKLAYPTLFSWCYSSLLNEVFQASWIKLSKIFGWNILSFFGWIYSSFSDEAFQPSYMKLSEILIWCFFYPRSNSPGLKIFLIFFNRTVQAAWIKLLMFFWKISLYDVRFEFGRYTPLNKMIDGQLL